MNGALKKVGLGMVAAITIVTGCSRHATIDTSGLEDNFLAADADCQNCVDRAVGAIKAGDLADATLELRTVYQNISLTPEQHIAIRTVLAQIDRAERKAAPRIAANGLPK